MTNAGEIGSRGVNYAACYTRRAEIKLNIENRIISADTDIHDPSVNEWKCHTHVR